MAKAHFINSMIFLEYIKVFSNFNKTIFENHSFLRHFYEKNYLNLFSNFYLTFLSIRIAKIYIKEMIKNTRSYLENIRFTFL